MKYTKLLVISYLGAEFIGDLKLNIKNLECLKDLENLIYDYYPTMFIEEKYRLYWRSGPASFVEICDFLSLYTAQKIMVENHLYMVVLDKAPWNYDPKRIVSIFEKPVLDEMGTLEELSENLDSLRFYTIDWKQRFKIIAGLRKGIWVKLYR